MLKKNPLLKYLMPNKSKSEIFHSSTYARAQSQSNFGSASDQSFSTRQALEQQRTTIQNYKFSKVATGISRNPCQSTNSAVRSAPIPSSESASSSDSRLGVPPSRLSSSRLSSSRLSSSRLGQNTPPRGVPSSRPSFTRPPFSRSK